MSLLERISNLLRRDRIDNELQEELQFHLDARMRDNLSAGMNAQAAQQDTRIRFGNATLAKERAHEANIVVFIETIGRDLRYAFRQYCKAPGFTFTAILVLALGMAASVSIFAFVNAALLRPLPFQDPSRLAAVFEDTPSCPQCGISYPDYQDWKSSKQVFRSLEIWEDNAYLWRSPAGAVALRGGRVSGGFFQTLGVTPALGRPLQSSRRHA